MKMGFFITGTDTDVGKTWVTVALMRRFRQKGFSVAGMKPVAAGCKRQNGRLRNQDALLIQENASVTLEYEQVNPYAFKLPVSPHLACGDVEVSLDIILEGLSKLQQQSDVVLVEGAGGWLSPMSVKIDNADLAVALQMPVIVVVGIRLGCINHARLTFQAIRQSGVKCAGWVAVEIVPDRADFQANLEFLKSRIEAPLLGVLPHLNDADFDFLSMQIWL
ncbi:MAG: dethiobiotin synthase [Methylomonas sp.]